MRVFLLFVFAGIGLVVAVAVLAFAFQRRLLYFPVRTSEQAALSRAAQLGLVPWRAADGSIRGWRRPPDAASRAQVLVFHGNAGSALDRSYYSEALVPRNVSVTIVEYPGYGARPGSPSEKTFAAAAVEAVDALAAESDEPVWLVGESIGSGVAARAARMRPAVVRGLLLVVPFARLTEVAHHHYPSLPAFFLRDRWSPQDDLGAFGGPVALLLAGRDEVVTVGQGRQLHASLRSAKRTWEQPDATHSSLDLRPDLPFWDEVVALLSATPR